MNHTTFRVWAGITWVVTLGIAYLIGWFKGVGSAAHVATSAVGGTLHSGMNFLLIALVVVALCSAVAAWRARKYFTRDGSLHQA